MSAVLSFIDTVVVPVILVASIVLAFLLPGRLPTGVRSAAYAGSCAGLVLCALYVVAVAPAQTSLEAFVANFQARVRGLLVGIGLEKLTFPGCAYLLAGAFGLVGGVVLARYYDPAQKKQKVCYVCLFLAASASMSLVNLFSFRPPHYFTLTLTLCAALGYLIYLMRRQSTAEKPFPGNTAGP